MANKHGKIQLLSKSQRSSSTVILSSEKKNKLDEAAIRCIIMDSRAFGDYRRPGMQEFLKVAVPGYFGPSRRTVQRNLSKLYVQKQQELKSELASVPNVSITADLWTSSGNRCFLCITAHYVSPITYDSTGKILSFRHFRGRHFGFRVRAHMHRVLKQYDLIGKVTSTTTDNGSDMRKATTLSRVFGIRFHCIAHALNLVVHKALGLWPKKKSNTAEAFSASQSGPTECVLFFFETKSFIFL